MFDKISALTVLSKFGGAEVKGDSDGLAAVSLKDGARRRCRERCQRADRLLSRVRKV